MIHVGPEIVSASAVSDQLSPTMSGSFEIKYPELVNSSKIPQDVALAMRPAWSAGLFIARPVRVLRMYNATVAAEGLAFTNDGRLVEETITQHSDDDICRAHQQYLFSKDFDPPTAKGNYVLCVKRGSTNYGHWLLEMLPKALLILEQLDRYKPLFIVPRLNGRLGSAIVSSLEAYGISKDRIIEQPYYPTKFANLMILDGLTHHGAYMSPWAVDLLQNLPLVIPQKPKKIFVTRGASRTRRIVNENYVYRWFEKHNYEIVDPETLNFVDQVKTFAQATHVVGIMGAGMANIVYSPERSHVTMLAPNCMPDTFFWFISGLKGHFYKEVRCDTCVRSDGNVSWNEDIIVSLSDMRKSLH